MAISAFYFLAYLFRGHEGGAETIFDAASCRQLASVLVISASLLTIFAASRDIITYHDNQVRLEYGRVNAENAEIRNDFGNIKEYQKTVDTTKTREIRERGWAAMIFFWCIYGIILMLVGLYKNSRNLLALGTTLNGLVILKVFFYDLWEFNTFYRFLNGLIAISSAYLPALLLYNGPVDGIFIKTKNMFAILIVAANIMTIATVSREIVVHYDKQIVVRNEDMTQTCYSYNRSSEPCQALQDDIRTLKNKASITLSIFWLVYAIFLVSVGFVKRYKWVRVGGVALLLVSIFKLFFYDLWSLGQFYRIIASISLGAVLLGISFAYQKYRHVFRDIIN